MHVHQRINRGTTTRPASCVTWCDGRYWTIRARCRSKASSLVNVQSERSAERSRL